MRPHRPWLTVPLAIGAFVALVAMLLSSTSPDAAARPRPTLSLTSAKSTYSVGEPLTLALTITNTTPSPVTIAATSFGTVALRATRNGKRLASVRSKGARFSVPPSWTQAKYLRVLEPLTGVTFDLLKDATYLPLLGFVGGTAQKTYATLHYDFTRPGVYRLAAQYKYSDKSYDGKRPGVLHSILKSNELVFEVR